MKCRFSSMAWWSYPSPPLDSGFRRSDELGIYPASWSGTCFHRNRSCRLASAHQDMKIGTAHTPLDSGAVSGFGVCSRREYEVGSPCGLRWWFRGWRSFAEC